MSALFFYLSHNPDIYKKLATEVRTTFSSGRDIRSGAQLTSCVYLHAVINETLRIAPSSIGVQWRKQDPAFHKEPFVVDGHVIPPGTSFGVSPYSFFHNEDYFPESFDFLPERWLPPAGQEETIEHKQKRDTMRRAFVPFSLGDRSCAGRSLAYLETSLVLARTLWFFDFEKAPGEAGQVGEGGHGADRNHIRGRERDDEFQLYDTFTAEHDGPNLTFKPRGAFQKIPHD